MNFPVIIKNASLIDASSLLLSACGGDDNPFANVVPLATAQTV